MPDQNLVSSTELAARIVQEAESATPDSALLLGWMKTLAEFARTDAKLAQSRDDACSVLLQRFIDMGDFAALCDLLRAKARWTGNTISSGPEIAAILASATKDRVVQAKIECSGFGRRHPVEALDRLALLMTLVPGAAVADGRRGYGVVEALDDFYRTATVKFDSDPDHPRKIGFAFAADSLRLVGPDHVLALRHADPEGFAKKEPAEIVKLALKSYGKMPLARLREFLVAAVLPAGSDWRAFWTKARAKLALDPSVHLPAAAKKNEELEFWADAEQGAREASAATFRKFLANHDPKAILEQVSLYLRTGDSDLDDAAKAARAEAIRDRLAYAVKACVADKRLGNPVKVRALVLALAAGAKTLQVRLRFTDEESRENTLDEFAFVGELPETSDGVKDDPVEIDIVATLSKPSILLDAAKKLPASQMEDVLGKIPLATDADVARAFVSVVPRMTSNLVDHIVPKLIDGPAKADFAAMVRDQFAQTEVYDPEAPVDEDESGATAAVGLSFPLLRWICRAQASKTLQPLVYATVSPFAIASIASVALSMGVDKENLRMRNDLKKLFIAGRRETSDGKTLEVDEGSKWLEPLLKDMGPAERSAIFVRIQSLESVWEPLRKRNLVAHLQRAFPGIGEGAGAAVPEESAAKAAAAAFDREDVTSQRTYRERQAQLRHLLDVEMPQNRKDIEFAKGFGDLSENFEYESARAKERELVARQTQLEADLKRVSAFDFEGVPRGGAAGLGSAVTVAGEDGAEKTYSILGDWDSAPDLGILSHQTPLAKALIGHSEGDTVEIPAGEDAVRTVVVKAVAPLSPEVVAWTKG